MSGAPVVIATNGYGMAVRPVDSGAPVLTVAENGFGMPIVISDLGAPFVVEGLWSPEDMFSANTQGTYFDPSDRTTLYQDAAGTTPAWLPGDPVGLVLDKSGRNNHATQTVAASRPTLARHPKGGRRNLLTQTENFADAAWLKSANGVVTPGQLDPLGGNTAFRFTATDVGAGLYQVGNMPIGNATAEVWLRRVTAGTLQSKVSNNVFQTINPTGEWQKFTLSEAVASANTELLQFRGTTAGVAFDIWHPQLELGTVATPYQRVTTAYDVTEAGVADLWYLAFDGVDDFMVTPAIDLTATDKVGVFAGVRKLSDASIGMVAEFSANVNSNNGSFWLAAPIGNGVANFDFASKGTVGQSKNRSGYAAPVSAVLGGWASISSPTVNLRVNAVETSAQINDQGAGNFGNYPLYIGRRGGTTLPFNGNLYGLIVAGKMPTAAEITNTEAYLNGKTGAY